MFDQINQFMCWMLYGSILSERTECGLSSVEEIGFLHSICDTSLNGRIHASYPDRRQWDTDWILPF